MVERFKRGLLEQHESLDAEEDSALPDWLAKKHERTLQKQGVDETLKIAARDVEKYLSDKATFLRELRAFGLNLEKATGRATDRSVALKLWGDCGYYVLVHDRDVYKAVEEVESRVDDYLDGQESASPSVADPAILTSRFNQQNIEATIGFTEKQREFLIALSEFISKAFQLDYRILKFRRDVLGDPERTISYEEATNLVRSPAAQRLPLNFFTETRTPVVGHTAERMPVEDGPHNLYVEPPPQFVDATEIAGKPVSLRWIGTNGVLEEHSVADSSVLGRLQVLCKHLVKRPPP